MESELEAGYYVGSTALFLCAETGYGMLNERITVPGMRPQNHDLHHYFYTKNNEKSMLTDFVVFLEKPHPGGGGGEISTDNSNL